MYVSFPAGWPSFFKDPYFYTLTIVYVYINKKQKRHVQEGLYQNPKKKKVEKETNFNLRESIPIRIKKSSNDQNKLSYQIISH